jgi:pimeloyl-ACP methyl ester carboxylesterase
MKTSSITFLGKPVTLYESGSTTHPALLMIHGNSAPSYFLIPLIHLLESKYHIITLDMPGHNQSGAWEKEDFTRANLALLFNSVLDKFQIKEVNAFGFSMGGFILLETFDLLPAIKKLAIAGHPPLKSVADMQEAYYLNEDSALYLQGTLSEAEIERIYTAVIGIQDEKLKFEIKESLRNTSPLFREGCMNLAQHTSDQIARLNQFPVLIDIIHAIEDKAVKLEYLQKLQIQNLWEQKIQLVPDCGHFIIAEKHEELAELLDRFFKES